ncbi:MAG TPA: mechanosensitive ion channel [Panacibacter sp.]|nr:mechanosensitive ion channel [Panacibacter sp.]HNP42990.1 mechanosensitive ion channel [Panacibacter sp.]
MKKTALLFASVFMIVFCCTGQGSNTDSLTWKAIERSKDILSDSSTLTMMTKLSGTIDAINAINLSLDKGFNTRSIDAGITDIEERIAYSDSVINGLEDHLSYRLLKSQSVFLEQVKKNLDAYSKQLTRLNQDIAKAQKNILHFINDPSFKINATDSILKEELVSDYKRILEKWISADSVNKIRSTQIAKVEGRITVDYMKWATLSESIKAKLENFNQNILKPSDRPLLRAEKSDYPQDIFEITKRSAKAGSTIMMYYLKSQWVADFTTILLAAWFFAWIIFIEKQFKKNIIGYMRSMGVRLKYLSSNPFYATLLLAFSISPFFFPNPPVIFVELMWSLLGLVLTALFFKDKRITWRVRILWAVFFVLFRVVAFLNLYLYTSYEERWLLLLLNVVLIAISVVQYLTNKKALIFNRSRALMMTVLVVVLHTGAIVCNFMGLFNLAKVLTASATFGLFTAIVLHVFVDVIKEALTFQLAHLRILFLNVHEKTFLRLYQLLTSTLAFLAAVAWVVIFLQSLNIFSYLKDSVTVFLNNPIELGSTTFTIGGVLLYLFIIWVSVVLSNFISILTDLTTTENKKYFGLSNVKLFLKLGVITGGVLLAFMATGIPMDKLAIVLGALGVGISFGLQHLVSNLVAGLMISMERPIKVGDTIEIGEHKGTVKEIGVRSIHITSSNGAEIIIPNGDLLTRHVVNWTLNNKNVRVTVTLLIKYENDLHSAKALVAEALCNDSLIMRTPGPQILTNDLSYGSIELSCYFWCSDLSKADAIKGEVLENIYDRFKKNNITFREFNDASAKH